MLHLRTFSLLLSLLWLSTNLKFFFSKKKKHSTPFNIAIGPLASEPGSPPVLSLRTIKSDVVVGIPQEVAERLDLEEPGWKISGKYAVVLLSEGKGGEGVVL